MRLLRSIGFGPGTPRRKALGEGPVCLHTSAPTDSVEPLPTQGTSPKAKGGGIKRALGTGLKSGILAAANWLVSTGEAVRQVGLDLGQGLYPDPFPDVPAEYPSLADPLKQEPALELERPLVVVSGWQMKSDTVVPLTRKLAEGNGVAYVQNGKFYRTPLMCKETDPAELPSTKAFICLNPNNRSDVGDAAKTLDQSLDKITEVTGESKVDVLGYSQGGLATRVLLDQGEDRIEKFLMVGTPNLGSTMANVALELAGQSSEEPLTPTLQHRLGEGVEDGLGWLCAGEGNEALTDLNSRAEEQFSRVSDVAILGSRSKPTLSGRGIARGDGVVPKENLSVGGVTAELVPGAGGHGELLGSPAMYGQIHEFFLTDEARSINREGRSRG